MNQYRIVVAARKGGVGKSTIPCGIASLYLIPYSIMLFVTLSKTYKLLIFVEAVRLRIKLFMQDLLIIFTRYPEPGKTKTRMIHILGEMGAVNLHRQMTEATLAKVSKLKKNNSLSIAVYFSGGNESLMQDWLGDNLEYYQQDNGDLGQRMQAAFQESLQKEFERVIIIGTDCPDLSQSIIIEAFDSLKLFDVVLGAAVDGGYYLIGLNRLIPELFTGIIWGTSEVLGQTKMIIQRLELNAYYLPLLADIDRPEDLPIWLNSNR